MILDNPIKLLHNLEFNKYKAKSYGESLLIHSYNVYSIVKNLIEFIPNLSEKNKTKLKIAALLHDYGKTYKEFQDKLHGRHRLLDEDVKKLKEIIRNIGNFVDEEIEDIIYIIQNHHGIELEKVDSTRDKLTRIVSICDTIASNFDISEDVINLINSLIDSLEYKCISVELIEHPISSYVIGAFDYIYKINNIEPILFSKNGTVYIKKKSQKIPNIEEVNKYLNEKIDEDFSSKGIIKFKSNNRIFTKPEEFLKLANNPDKFIEIVQEEIAPRLIWFKKITDSENEERKFLIGRVCGSVYKYLLELLSDQIKKSKIEGKNKFLEILQKKQNEILDYPLFKGSNRKTLFSSELGGRPDEKTVDFIKNKYGKNKSYKIILKEILDDFKEELKFVNQNISSNYNIIDLMVKDSDLINTKDLDIQKEAKTDYERYWNKNPIDVCRICHNFKQEPTSASLFPSSDLGGSTSVFLTDIMREPEEFKKKGGVCKWCYLWFLLLKNKTGNRMYKLSVVPHALFGRINWDEIFDPEETIYIGQRENYISPHVAVIRLSGDRYNDFILQAIKNRIIDKLYSNGLSGKVISTLVEPTNYLFDCGAIQIDFAEYRLFKPILENINPAKGSNNYALAVKSIKNNIYSWGYLIKTKKLEGGVKMVAELGEETGLSFLRNIWIGGMGENRISNAEKVVRRMNETLRKLKGKEQNKDVVMDAMTSIGLKVAIATRATKEHPGIYGRDNPKGQLEIISLRQLAEMLYTHRENSAFRTEIVRAMSCYLGYVPYTLEVSK